MQEIRPPPNAISHMAFALGETGISASRTHGHSHRESFRRDGNNATIRGNKRARDLSWTVPKLGSTNRIAPGGSSQTPPTTLQAASVARRRNRRPPRLNPRRRRNLTSPKLPSPPRGWTAVVEPARQGETGNGRERHYQGPAERTRDTKQRRQSRHAQTRVVKIPSGTSDCLLKLRCCSNHPSPLGLGRTDTRTFTNTTNACNSPSPKPFRHGAWLFPETIRRQSTRHGEEY